MLNVLQLPVIKIDLML